MGTDIGGASIQSPPRGPTTTKLTEENYSHNSPAKETQQEHDQASHCPSQNTSHDNKTTQVKSTAHNCANKTKDKAISRNGSVSILGLNVCGLISKLNLCVLEDYICDNFDILCLTETKLDRIDEENIMLEGYTPFYHYRKKFTRKSGGVATFVKNNLARSAKKNKGQRS